MRWLTLNRLTVAAIMALLALIAVIGADNARADFHDRTLVQNSHLTSNISAGVGAAQNGIIGQRFTTGSNSDGYTLTSIGVDVTGLTQANLTSVTMRLHEFDGTKTNDLGDIVATMTTPTLTTGQLNYFTAPNNTTLDASANYIINFHVVGTSPSDLLLRVVLDDGETGATGWSIENARRVSGATFSSNSLVIDVRGVIAGASDPTLSNLELEDPASGDAVSFNETFDSGTAAYTATVEYRVTQLTLTPTTYVDDATFEFLTGTDADLDDADDETDGHQVDLETGANIIKVKVTSSDETEDATYTVTVTRLAYTTLVKNTHLPAGTFEGIGSIQNGGIGQRFTTGNNLSGYQLVSVGVNIAAVVFPAARPQRCESTSSTKPQRTTLECSSPHSIRPRWPTTR